MPKITDKLAKVLPRTWCPNQVVAHNLTRARLLRGWTQDQAAAELAPYLGFHLSAASFSAIERSIAGTRVKQFTADELVALSRAFDLPLGWWFTPPDDGTMYTPTTSAPASTSTSSSTSCSAPPTPFPPGPTPSNTGPPSKPTPPSQPPSGAGPPDPPSRSSYAPAPSSVNASETSPKPATSSAASRRSSTPWTPRHTPARGETIYHGKRGQGSSPCPARARAGTMGDTLTSAGERLRPRCCTGGLPAATTATR